MTSCAALALTLSGCSHFHPKPSRQYVYVTAKEAILRDRVAAVSNRTGTVTNGEKLIVLDHARRFLKVQTPNGTIGWIEERQTAGPTIADTFEALGEAHKNDPVIATATASDEVYLHVAPGRTTDHFYLLAENDPLSLLERASIPKPLPPGVTAATAPPDASGAPPAPAMEDWWLVRDSKGQTGWLYGRMADIVTPDALLRYANGQRIVGAYILAHVDDPDSGIVVNNAPVTSVPEYLTVLTPYKAGLPYDFNQVRVFIWNAKKHRYETGFSDHNIAGYLPVTIGRQTDPTAKGIDATEKLPSFTYRVLADGQPMPTPNPTTGLFKPGATIEKTYLLEGNICRRILAPGTQPPPEAHPDPVAEKKLHARIRATSPHHHRR
ncbi:MAG: SH3 domain-containing protein [Acidobacteria bacterium]|nr:SH3 domain-containing protein [Acidobacteriota bacterium]